MLAIEESVAAPAVQKDGSVLMHLIRPCVGKGKGRHVYESGMLRENAHKFSGWRMFFNHDTASDRKARQGLPRDVRDIGGIVMESHWDPTVPADGRFGQGAVVARVKAHPKVRELLELHPSLVEASINARATSVRPVQREGGQAWLVEGIEPKGSVDWVSEGGAGGKVVELLEAAFDGTPEEQEAALFESMTDVEAVEHLRATRPDLIELVEAAAKGDSPMDDPEYQGHFARFKKSGLDDDAAHKMAAKACAKKAQEAATEDEDKSKSGENDDPTGGEVAEVTAEQILEALAKPEVAQAITDLVEARVEEARGEIETRARAQAYADTERSIELRDMRDEAHKAIAEANLPEQFAAAARAKFDLVEGSPSAALDVWETTDDDDQVVKSASEVLAEAVALEIESQRTLVASVLPTRVRGQGPAAPAGGEGGEGEAAERKVVLAPAMKQLLQESGFEEPEKVFEQVGN